MDDKFLYGQTAIVTGAGRGIGREIAIALADAGANIVVCARNKDEIYETSQLITNKGGESIAVPADVTNMQSVENLVKVTLNRFKTIELLVNNAGTSSSPGRIWEIKPYEWHNTIFVNLMGAFNMTHSVMKEMIRQRKGRIINIGSNAALYSRSDGSSAYSVSKAGLLRLSTSIAAEGSEFDVYGFSISPGLVKTEMTKDLYLFKNVPEDNWLPIELAGKLCVSIASGKCDKLNGRYIHVMDNLEEMIDNAEVIKNKNLYNLTINEL